MSIDTKHLAEAYLCNVVNSESGSLCTTWSGIRNVAFACGYSELVSCNAGGFSMSKGALSRTIFGGNGIPQSKSYGTNEVNGKDSCSNTSLSASIGIKLTVNGSDDGGGGDG